MSTLIMKTCNKLTQLCSFLLIFTMYLEVCTSRLILVTLYTLNIRLGHIMHIDENADAKRILLASPPVDWRRQPGRPRITWLSTIQQYLKHHITFPEAADLGQNCPLWRMMSTYGAMQS